MKRGWIRKALIGVGVVLVGVAAYAYDYVKDIAALGAALWATISLIR